MKKTLNPDRSTAISAVRDFWNRRPCNVRHSARSMGSKEYFDEVEARKYFSEIVERHSEAQTGSPVTYTYTRRTIGELLRGFVIDSTSIDHIFPYRISEYIQYRYVKVWYFRYLPEFALRWLEKRAGWHLCVTAHFASEADLEANAVESLGGVA